jgi:hypothetical protein
VVGELSHPGSRRARAVSAEDSERELKSLKNPLKVSTPNSTKPL